MNYNQLDEGHQKRKVERGDVEEMGSCGSSSEGRKRVRVEGEQLGVFRVLDIMWN